MPSRRGPLSDSSEATFTMAPAPRATMPGSAARESVTGAVTWMAIDAAHDVGVDLGEGPVAREAGVVDEQRQAPLGGDAPLDAGHVAGVGEVGDQTSTSAPAAAASCAASASRRSRRRATTTRS